MTTEPTPEQVEDAKKIIEICDVESHALERRSVSVAAFLAARDAKCGGTNCENKCCAPESWKVWRFRAEEAADNLENAKFEYRKGVDHFRSKCEAAESERDSLRLALDEAVKALDDIAKGMVEPGVITNAVLSSPLAFKDTMFTWCQTTARERLAKIAKLRGEKQ